MRVIGISPVRLETHFIPYFRVRPLEPPVHASQEFSQCGARSDWPFASGVGASGPETTGG